MDEKMIKPMPSFHKESPNMELKLLIKSGSVANPAKWLTLPLASFLEFINALHEEVKSLLGYENIKKKHYTVAYKESTARKSLMVLVSLTKHNNKKGNNREWKRKKKAVSKGSESSSSTSTSDIPTMPKKKAKMPKVKDLNENEIRIAETINVLRNRYHCTQHDRSCLVQNHHHLRLTPSHLKLWAHDTLHGGSIESPPTLPLFGMNSSKELSAPRPIQQSYLPPPPHYYTYAPSYPPSSPSSLSLSHSTVLSPQKKILIPSIKEFLSELDEIHGEGTYTRFEDSFVEQEVLVQFISELTDTKFEKLGVEKIGWRKVLKRAALKYA
ncbi:9545_t:CDS:2 [Paraglomus occultum]|uniref:9545_t:CDS:1 n=1 Tax=Paraglomus occultum TaxID=144539 RepID=A0A9N9CFH3_9GLOM|nr:9545_t:CDS:2 [Paraglomus occultum]